MNTETARFNMVEQQIRPWEVLDTRVLTRMAELPREPFVDEAYHGLAYADAEIPLATGQHMLAPRIVGRMLQALAPIGSDRALEIGTGSGYVTALLAFLSRHVVSLEIDAALHARAAQTLRQQGIMNVTLKCMDGRDGFADGGPYEVIAVTGGMLEVNKHLTAQLADGGRMFVILGRPPVMTATLVTRASNGQVTEQSLFECLVPPLRGCEPRPQFSF